MTVRQAGASISDDGLFDAARVGGTTNMDELLSSANKDGPLSLLQPKCRLYPKLSYFFDGTGNNLDIDEPLHRLSNVAKLYRAATSDPEGGGAQP